MSGSLEKTGTCIVFQTNKVIKALQPKQYRFFNLLFSALFCFHF